MTAVRGYLASADASSGVEVDLYDETGAAISIESTQRLRLFSVIAATNLTNQTVDLHFGSSNVASKRIGTWISITAQQPVSRTFGARGTAGAVGESIYCTASAVGAVYVAFEGLLE